MWHGVHAVQLASRGARPRVCPTGSRARKRPAVVVGAALERDASLGLGSECQTPFHLESWFYRVELIN